MPQQADGFYLPTPGFDGNRADELIERLAVIRVEEKEIEVNTTIAGRKDKSAATVVLAMTIDNDGTVTNYGRMPIFWQHVRNQLSRTPEGEWTAGIISKPDGWDAYRMDAPDPASYPLIKQAIRGELPPVYEKDDTAPFD